MKIFSLILLLFNLHNLCHSQVQGVVVDKVSGNPVPYANIWIENEPIGVSADADGNFIINGKELAGKFLVVTSVAYEKQRIQISGNLHKIELTPVIYQLKETVVNATGRKKVVDFKIKDGSFTATQPWIVARFYPYLEQYKQTPFLTEVSFGTYSRGKASKYRIRLLSVNEKNEPGNDLIQQPLLFTSQRGENTIRLELQKYNIEIPPNGFFVGFEFIQPYKKDGIQHLGVDAKIVEYDDGRSWMYINGGWLKKGFPGYKNKGAFELQFKLTLSE